MTGMVGRYAIGVGIWWVVGYFFTSHARIN